MKTIECDREQDLLDAIASRRWSTDVRGGTRAGARDMAELREHASRCPICADLVEVALALRDAHTRACRDARVPAPGLVWWRAALRARHEGARVAARPLLLAQALAWVCAAGGAAVLAGRVWPRIAWTEWLTAIQPSLPLALVLGAWLVLTPIALYLAFSDE